MIFELRVEGEGREGEEMSIFGGCKMFNILIFFVEVCCFGCFNFLFYFHLFVCLLCVLVDLVYFLCCNLIDSTVAL